MLPLHDIVSTLLTSKQTLYQYVKPSCAYYYWVGFEICLKILEVDINQLILIV